MAGAFPRLCQALGTNPGHRPPPEPPPLAPLPPELCWEGRTRTRSSEDFRGALEEKEGRTKRSWEEAMPGPLMHFKREQSRLFIFSFPDPVFHFKSALTFWLSFLLISQVWSVRIHSSVWHRKAQRQITPGDEGAPQCLSATSLP